VLITPTYITLSVLNNALLELTPLLTLMVKTSVLPALLTVTFVLDLKLAKSVLSVSYITENVSKSVLKELMLTTIKLDVFLALKTVLIANLVLPAKSALLDSSYITENAGKLVLMEAIPKTKNYVILALKTALSVLLENAKYVLKDTL
jgi:hypothetical protein